MKADAMLRSELERRVSAALGCRVRAEKKLGAGCLGGVYRMRREDGAPLAVKVSPYADVLREEYDQLVFLSEQADCKTPRCYAFCAEEGAPALLCMACLSGISASSARIRHARKAKRERFADEATDNLIRLHAHKGEKFGPYRNAVYDTWDAYYYPFAESVLRFAEGATAEGRFEEAFSACMRRAFGLYERIFDQPVGAPSLIHGDYWMPNLMADPKTLALTGVVDPFNVLYADRDYELFALFAMGEKRFHLYEIYKKKQNVPEKTDLKCAFYALFSEIFFFQRTGNYCAPFVKLKCDCLDAELRRFGLAGGVR